MWIETLPIGFGYYYWVNQNAPSFYWNFHRIFVIFTNRNITLFRCCKIDLNNSLFHKNIIVKFLSKILRFIREKSVFTVRNARQFFGKNTISKRTIINFGMQVRCSAWRTTYPSHGNLIFPNILKKKTRKFPWKHRNLATFDCLYGVFPERDGRSGGGRASANRGASPWQRGHSDENLPPAISLPPSISVSTHIIFRLYSNQIQPISRRENSSAARTSPESQAGARLSPRGPPGGVAPIWRGFYFDP